MLKKFGNLFFLIQHVQIRLEHISKHFYQKMPSQVIFCGFPASLSILIKQVIVYLSVYLFAYGRKNRKA